MNTVKYTKQGIRDLNQLGKVAKTGVIQFENSVNENVWDYLYIEDNYEDEFIKDLKSWFPRAKESYNDDPYKGRQTIVEIDNCKRENYYHFLIQNDWSLASVSFQISMYNDAGMIKGLLDKIRPNWCSKIKRK